MCAFLHGSEKIMWPRVPDVLDARALYLQEYAIELLPHLRANLLAHLAQIFSGSGKASDDGSSIFRIEGHRLGDFESIICASNSFGRMHAEQQPVPAPFGGGWRLVEHQVQADINQTRGVLGPLKITTHPVKTIGDSRKHQSTLEVS